VSWQTTRSKLAVAVRDKHPEPEITALRRDLRAERLEEHIKSIVDQAPPLTDQQRARIAALLQASGGTA
jgi:hypothetical protein